MAEQRFERDLQRWLAADLDPVRGPHPRWADAPVARRIGRPAMAQPRWRTVAWLAAAIGVAALSVIVAVVPREVRVATIPPTLEPWPSAINPSATPTSGEITLGRVAVATANGEPALLVRVSPAATRGGDGVGLTIEVRVIGPLDRAFGIDRFIVVRGGLSEAPGLGVTGPDPLAIAADAAIGTEVSTRVVIPAGPDENIDLGYAGSGTSIAFRYPVHRPPLPPSPASMEGRCPTLEDYAIASLQPSAEPAPPSFAPVAPNATPSTGLLALGETGILPAPGGSPGALVRVTNVRLCDRLPDYRPDWMGGPARLLLADVEIKSLAPGALREGFIPGRSVVVANYGGRFDLNEALVFGMPGGNRTTTLDTAPSFAYRGTVAWDIPDDGVRITIDALGTADGANGTPLARFSYLVRDGTSGSPPPTPELTDDPAATPTSGMARLGERVVLAAEGGTTRLVVGGVDVVPRYPGLAPSPPAGAFLEARLDFGRGGGTFTLDPAEWLVVGPDGGTLPLLHLPTERTLPDGLPNVSSIGTEVATIPPDDPLPLWLIAEVPSSGRITLEYRPGGGRALVTWVLRDR
jgi:hypothetical protein